MTQLFSDLAADPEPRRPSAGLWARRAIIAVFATVSVLGLAGVFGQRSSRSEASAPAASLRLTAPKAARGGLFFQSRIEIGAKRAIAQPRLVLDDGWVEGMQVNSIEPAPVAESSRDGRLVLSYDRIEAGERLVVWLQFEVNPTNVGHRDYGLELDDARAPLATVHRRIRIFP